MSNGSNTLADRKSAKSSWRQTILRAAIIGVLPFVGACANSVKESAKIDSFNPSPRPMVLPGSPTRDSLANDLSDQQLSEADWRILQSLGPKAIWERIAEMNRSARERRVVNA